MGETSHLMIDGAAIPGTALTLSHWPKSGTPWPLKGDLSAEIVFHYLKNPRFHVDAEAATNTHFDTDGLVGVWTALYPESALAQEALLVQIAKAGDFSAFEDWRAYRISAALNAYADSGSSPLPPSVFEGEYADSCGHLYESLLGLLPEMMAEPDVFKKYWQEPEAALKQATDWIRSGKIGLKEDKQLELAVFDLPAGITEAQVPAEVLHNASQQMAVLVRAGQCFRFYYRYETWVQFVSRPLRRRVDLRPLAKKLSAMETGGGRWQIPGPDNLSPVLSLEGQTESSIASDIFETTLKEAMANGLPAFDPFDPQ